MLIQDVLERDLRKRIEEIILVDQIDEQSVYDEITDYVVTDRMREQYRAVLRAIAEGPSEMDESVGVWISGFFGSGKSSFAKILGYVIANRQVLGHSAADLFKQQVNDSLVSDLVDSINSRIPYEVVMFDVQKDRAQTGQGNLSISPYMYRVLLRELGYAEDFDIAELEIGLEAEGRLDEFIERFNAKYASSDERNAWSRRGRSGSQVWNRVGVILHQMDPHTYPAPESFAHSLAEKRVEVTPRLLVDRSFDLVQRRRGNVGLTYIIDEIGAYVAYSQDRLEDLRAVVELFGKESKNRIKAHKAIAPTWVIVTAQEQIHEVTAAMGDEKRVLFAKVQDRFQHRIDLSPADIREVATRRVLAKKDTAPLDALFTTNQGMLNIACQLERTSRWSEMTAEAFSRFYPYLPHYIELSIDIMSGIRLQPGAVRHIGGSNRTIISQVYQMLVNERTNYAAQPVGVLVTLDQLYELIEGQVGTAKQKDIHDITERYRHDPQDQGWAGRVARVIALLEFVAHLPRTAANIAALLVDQVGQPAPLPEVQAALDRLLRNEFIRETEQGYKLQTAQEKTWAEERKRYLEPRPKERKDLLREMLTAQFHEAAFKTYHFQGLRSFRVGVSIDGMSPGETAQVPLHLIIADDAEELPRTVDEARTSSRLPDHQNEIVWVFALTPEIDDLVAHLYASRQMMSKYNALRAQQKITTEESTSLDGEKADESRHRSRLQANLAEALSQGQGVFRGTVKDASDLGRTPAEIFKKLFDACVPDLYPKLEMGARPLKGNEAEEVLKAANLNALPQVFYTGDTGLGLVVKEGQKYVPNPAAPIAKEVLDYLRREHGYGNRVTGKDLINQFQGIGYGWDTDMIRLVLAVLLRAGAIEITHQSRRFRNHQDPQCRTPLVNITAFRSAGFAPRDAIDLKTLIAAVRSYEELTGDDIDVEEGAIAAAFKKLADDEMTQLLAVVAEARANDLPGQSVLENYRDMLLAVQGAASDDCVRILAGEGTSYKAVRDQVRRLREAVSAPNLDTLRRGRTVVTTLWPEVQQRQETPDLADYAAEVQHLTQAEDFFAHLPRMKTLTDQIQAAYRTLYQERHEQRHQTYAQAIDAIKGCTEWGVLIEAIKGGVLTEAMRDALLQPLTERRCISIKPDDEAEPPPGILPDGATRCIHCHATPGQIESDSAAVEGHQRQVLIRLQEVTAPEEKVVRIRVASLVTTKLDTTEAVDKALDGVRTELYKRIAEGAVIVLE